MGNALGDLLSGGEGGYGSFNRGKAGDAHGATIDFSKLSIADVMERQHLAHDDPEKIFAVGKYQIIPLTMKGAVASLHLDSNEKFTPELQERIFADYLIADKRPQIESYIKGEQGATLHAAQKAACQEWASVADPDTGKSFAPYLAHGNNHASITSGQIAVTLNAMRAEYQTSIATGMSPENAWKTITAVGETPVHTKQHSTEFIAHPGSLRPGDRGEAVGIVQQELRDLGYTDAKGKPLTVDKDFGASTTAAIKTFQSEHALTSDGIVGKDTANALTQQVDVLQKNQGPNALNAPNASDAIRDSSARNAFEAIAAATDRGMMDGTSAPTISGANRLPNVDSKPTPDHAAPTSASTHAPSDPRHPENPQHAKYEKLREQITAAYDKHGLSLPPEQLERVTASVMLDAQKRPMKDIKEVHLNPAPGTREVHANSQVLAFSSDPKDVTTFKSITDVQQARQTPPEQSYQQLAQVTQQQAPMQAVQLQASAHAQPAAPGGSGTGR